DPPHFPGAGNPDRADRDHARRGAGAGGGRDGQSRPLDPDRPVDLFHRSSPGAYPAARRAVRDGGEPGVGDAGAALLFAPGWTAPAMRTWIRMPWRTCGIASWALSSSSIISCGNSPLWRT